MIACEKGMLWLYVTSYAFIMLATSCMPHPLSRVMILDLTHCNLLCLGLNEGNGKTKCSLCNILTLHTVFSLPAM